MRIIPGDVPIVAPQFLVRLGCVMDNDQQDRMNLSQAHRQETLLRSMVSFFEEALVSGKIPIFMKQDPHTRTTTYSLAIAVHPDGYQRPFGVGDFKGGLIDRLTDVVGWQTGLNTGMTRPASDTPDRQPMEIEAPTAPDPVDVTLDRHDVTPLGPTPPKL